MGLQYLEEYVIVAAVFAHYPIIKFVIFSKASSI
jgi:hypothetical protein